ncbi:DEAD/DEAH box helicase [Paenibacillus vini]|uniref:DEAD/DEAH box helicase n=1 Tax=Paenibacillus vini TaxID=1476024 RepID=UPI0025B6E953|nr:DEAD/DEAH box helicase [Paenibacillus vini]MDN4069751.1 DEAD/DEAH box helicase [Paenibacillus vini]
MNQRLYGIWLGDVLFCFSGEISETKVDAWTAAVRPLEPTTGVRPFQHAALRLAEIRYPVSSGRRMTATGDRKGLIGRTLEGLALPVQETWQLLLNWDESYFAANGIEPGPELEYWSVAARFALDLLLRGKIVPGSKPGVGVLGRRRGTQAAISAVWGPYLIDDDEVTFRQLAGSMPPVALAAVQPLALLENGSLGDRQLALLHSFLTAMIDYEVRKAVMDLGRKLNPARADYRRGYSPLTELWWNGLLSAAIQPDIQGNSAEIEHLTEEIAEAGGARPSAADEDGEDGDAGSLRLCLRVEPILDNGGFEPEQDFRWKLSLWGEGTEDPSVLLPAGLIWSYPAPDMTIRGRKYRNVRQNLLLRLKKAADLSHELAAAMETARPEVLELYPEEMYSFLSRSVALLRKHGVNVQMPSRWTREGRRSAGVKIKASGWEKERGDKEPETGLGIGQLVAFEAGAVLNGEELSREELAELAASKSPLVFFRGEWIEIDVKEIRQVLKFMKRQESGTMTFRELMYLASGADQDNRFDGLQVETVEAEGLLAVLMSGETVRSFSSRQVPEALNGTLRPYQERGFQWLSSMRQLGFGALLADDMGLGKTVQVITELLDGMETLPGTCLIVCPTSLLGNWQRELERFAPEMKVYVHHGSDRLHGEPLMRECHESDVVLTTYQLAGRDGMELRNLEWKTIVLDEAQYIKNYGTKQAQSVMKLSAPQRIAMTGTPVENRLSELWSIFQFLNPGYLGTSASFRAKYTSSGEGQPAELGRLRRLVAPFLLRRLKSDPDIRKDLPEKIELKSYCSLTAQQAGMYEAVTAELMSKIGESGGIARKGLVLSSLTRLKQICNHPRLAAGRPLSGAAAGMERSGKMERLTELLDIIMDNGEAALIFTQYVQMGELLREELARRYGTTPFFLHGGVVKQERDEMVRSFQEGSGVPIFVLSLKAGGVGLNLTRANHVIHYDRWWNPAVENQATDRVFRIGQQKNVEVHKLICQGTLEERIDELIERKRSLSEQVVGSGEQWLTEMSDDELRNLIALQSGSIIEEEVR